MYNQLSDKMEKLNKWLLDLYHQQGNGWPAVRVDDETGVLTTSAAVRTLVETGKMNYLEICPAIQYILNCQSNYSGWPMIRGNNLDAPLTTAEVIQALIAVKNKFPHQKIIPKVETAIKKAIQWLFSVQNEDGGWAAIVGRNEEVTKESSTYVTAIVVIALSLFLKTDNSIGTEVINHIEKAFKLLSDRREPNGLWKTFQNSQSADLAISAVVAYAYYSYDESESEDVLDTISMIGLNKNSEVPVLSLPLGWERIQLPDGEVRFFINGAYWACKLFADSCRSYIGYLPLINYLIENKSNHYELTCLVSGFKQEQSVWVSIDMLEIGSKILSIPCNIIGESILDAASFLSDAGRVRKNHQYVTEESIFKSGGVDKLATLMASNTSNGEDIRFCEALSQCLTLSKCLNNDDLSGLIEKYDYLLIDKLKTITSYDEYIQFSQSHSDYKGFSVINHVKACGNILKIINVLSTRNRDEAIKEFYRVVCSDMSPYITGIVFCDLFKLISLFITNHNETSTKLDQIFIVRNAIQPLFGVEILDQLFEKLESVTQQDTQYDELDTQINGFEPINTRINTGMPVTTEFWFLERREELNRACDNILNGVSLAITGDYRIGKTSFLQNLLAKLKTDHNYLVCDIDFTTPISNEEAEEVNEVHKFVEYLTKRVTTVLEDNGIGFNASEHVKSAISNALKKLESISVGPVSMSKSKAHDNTILQEIDSFIKLINSNYLKTEDRYLVIAIDEFNNSSSVTINQICRVITQKADHIRLIIAAQNIFDPRKQYGPAPLTTVLTTVSLRGFNENEIVKYISSVSDKLQINNPEASIIRDYTGGSPFWTGLLTNQIIEELNKARTYSISQSIVDKSIRAFLQSSDAKTKLEWYYEETTEKDELLKNILFHLSKTCWIKREELIKGLKTNNLEQKWKHEDYINRINMLISKGTVQERQRNGQTELSIINGIFRHWINKNYRGVE